MSVKKDSGKAVQEKAAVLWNVANTLAGLYKPHEYGLVILPMAVIKRFHDCLLPTHDKVLKKAEEIKKLQVKGAFLTKASGYQFYNTSKFTFETLCADAKNIARNFRDYLNGFSENVKDILDQMKFDDQVDAMDKGGVLYQVICDFNTEKANLSPDEIGTEDMGYIFENLVQRFSESYDEHAGAHFTSRDIIYLMCDLLVVGLERGKGGALADTLSAYDMAMGTSQMLTCVEDRLKMIDPSVQVLNHGQEINPFTYGIAKGDMLIRGGNPESMRYGNTLDDDKFPETTFNLVISNPPFGIDWKKEAAAVEREHRKGNAGRFAPGLPSKSDGQMLFMMNGVAKLKDNGRMAIIQNGSSLFTGDAGSGPSEIRRWLIENDWVEAIVQLPNDSFYNTGIATYVWLVTKSKAANRRGKVQLIDASKCYEARRKPIGNKRVDITNDCRALVVKAYEDFKTKDYTAKAGGGEIVCKSHVFDNAEFGYTKITVVSKDGTDTENVPLGEDIDTYMKREVLPYQPDAKVDKKKSKVGYEIPFTQTFYEFRKMEETAEVARRIKDNEKQLSARLKKLFEGV